MIAQIEKNVNSESTTSSLQTFDFCCLGILSITIATQPSNTSRTTIGVGEEIKLVLDTGAPVNWVIESGGGTLDMTFGEEIIFTAPATAGETKIIVNELNDLGCIPYIIFTIVEPLRMSYYCGDSPVCYHFPLTPSGGIAPDVYIRPNGVGCTI